MGWKEIEIKPLFFPQATYRLATSEGFHTGWFLCYEFTHVPTSPEIFSSQRRVAEAIPSSGMPVVAALFEEDHSSLADRLCFDFPNLLEVKKVC